MAEAVLRDRLGLSRMSCTVSSAGTLGLEGRPAAPNAVTACAERGLDLSAFRSRELTPARLAQADLVLCMEPKHLDECRRLSPAGGPRIELLGAVLPTGDGLLPSGAVQDPVGQDLDAFRRCLELLKHLCDHVLAREGLLPYAPYYCEENVWQLLHDERLRHQEGWALVVTNPARQVALWAQRAAPVVGTPVVWDYHVVAIVRDGPHIVVWDLDSVAGCPASFDHWFTETVRPTLLLPEEFHPQFRLVPASEYLLRFSSTRAHMRNEQGAFVVAPPPWPCIVAGAAPLSLQHLLDLPVGEAPGWLTAANLCAWVESYGDRES